MIESCSHLINSAAFRKSVVVGNEAHARLYRFTRQVVTELIGRCQVLRPRSRQLRELAVAVWQSCGMQHRPGHDDSASSS